MKCEYCDNEIQVGAARCNSCGAAVRAQPQPSVAPMPQQQSYGAVSAGAPVITGTKNKVIAGLLGIFLGAIGAHKFYLGKWGQGLVYLLLCWTYVPAFLGFWEGIGYLCTSDEKFWSKYR